MTSLTKRHLFKKRIQWSYLQDWTADTQWLEWLDIGQGRRFGQSLASVASTSLPPGRGRQGGGLEVRHGHCPANPISFAAGQFITTTASLSAAVITFRAR